jgi:hypothetical protein
MLTEALTDFRELNPKMINVVPSELVPLGELLKDAIFSVFARQSSKVRLLQR